MAATYTSAHHQTDTSTERYKKRVIPIWYSNNGRILFSGATGLRTTQVLEGIREISNATVELQNEESIQNVGMCKTTTYDEKKVSMTLTIPGGNIKTISSLIGQDLTTYAAIEPDVYEKQGNLQLLEVDENDQATGVTHIFTDLDVRILDFPGASDSATTYTVVLESYDKYNAVGYKGVWSHEIWWDDSSVVTPFPLAPNGSNLTYNMGTGNYSYAAAPTLVMKKIRPDEADEINQYLVYARADGVDLSGASFAYTPTRTLTPATPALALGVKLEVLYFVDSDGATTDYHPAMLVTGGRDLTVSFESYQP